MKKILSCLIVALLLIMALASCQISGGTVKPTEPAANPLENAKSFLYAMYKDEATTTTSDIIRLNTISSEGVQYSVEWSVEVLQGEADDVVIEAGDKSYEVKINVNEKTSVDVKYVLTATISDAEGNTISVSFAEYTVPAYAVMSWADYIAAAEGDPAVVRGVVTAIFCKSQGASYNGMYLQDNDGGYYIYSMANDVDPAEAGIKVGMTLEVSGTKTIYSGTHELKDAAAEILDAEEKELVVYDYTELYKNAASLGDASITEKQAQLVTINGVTVLPQDADVSNGYYKFQMGDLISYVRISSSVCPIPKAEQAAFIASHAEHTGWIANVTGVISLFDGKFYLTPVDANAFEYVGIPERTDAEKVEYEKENLTLTENITESGEIVLTVNGVTYESVLISWASDNNCVVVENGKLIVTLPEEAVNVTITATLTCGEAIVTKAFTVLVDAAATVQYAPNFLTSAPADGQYVFAMDQSAVEGYGVLYANGEIGSKGQLLTTDKAHKAAKFDIAAVEGGYTIKLGDKYLEGYLNGNYKNLRFSDTEAIWAWNDEAKVFTCDIDGAAYYFGTYLSSGVPKYDYMSLSAVSYITGDNLSKIDVSQFVGHLCEVKTVPAGDVHQHVAGAEWQKDADNHWNVCECGEIMNKAAHDFSNGDCVCGQAAPVVCEHQASSEWFKDDNNHWHNCALCGAEMDKAAHDFSNGDCVCGQEAPEVDGMTIAEVLASEVGAQVTFTGIVTGIYQAYNDEYNNISVYVSNGADRILVYRLTGNWAINDIITVTGKVAEYNNSKQIGQGGTAVKVGTHTCTEWAGGSCTTVSNCVACNAPKDAPGHNYVDGTCTACGEQEPATAPQYVKVTSADQITNGSYVLVVNNIALGYLDGTWILTATPTISDGVVTDTAAAVWTLTVSDNGVKLADKNGVYIKPSGGNNNGIKTGEYEWKLVWNADGTVTFMGQGSDTVYLASNNGSEGKFRAYKTSTVNGNPAGYPYTFTLYKLS